MNNLTKLNHYTIISVTLDVQHISLICVYSFCRTFKPEFVACCSLLGTRQSIVFVKIETIVHALLQLNNIVLKIQDSNVLHALQILYLLLLCWSSGICLRELQCAILV